MATVPEVIFPPLVPENHPRGDGGELRFLIRDLGWMGYQRLVNVFESRGFRIAYLDGMVELVTTGPRHELTKKILARMVEFLAMELGIAINALGSTTFHRASVGRGVEPDECYYLTGVDRLNAYLASPERPSPDAFLDLDEGPPPDLVIEIELTSPLLDKVAIYAGLGVAELWRYNGRTLTVLLLQPDGSYAEAAQSRAFPFLPLAAFARHLRDYDPRHESRWALTFRTWVREVVAPLFHP